MTYWYCATPYSKFSGGIEEAFKMACRQTALLIRAKVPVYSPIASTHPVAIHGGMDPLDHSIWLPADKPFMDAAKGLIVVMAEGWRESYGIGEEIKEFRAAGKPIIYMEEDVVPAILVPFMPAVRLP